MVKLCDLSKTARGYMVNDISVIMEQRYHIDKDSIGEFWGTVEIGIQARKQS